MEVDTGASLTLINKAACNLISQSGQPTELKGADIKLKMYTGEPVKSWEACENPGKHSC